MALFMTPETKEPLVETHTAQAIAKRSAEMVGVVLLLLAGLAAMMIGTYTPDDPGIFHATDRAPDNMLGLPGAMAADMLHRAVGWTAWGLPILGVVWGLRFLTHVGENRVLMRIIAAPFALAVGAVFLAAHSVPVGWAHDFGLGGLFGDAVLGGVIMALPGDVAQSLSWLNLSIKILTLCFGLIALGLSLMALGVTVAELRGFGRMIWSGSTAMFKGSSVAAKAAHATAGRAVAKTRDRVRTGAYSELSEPEIPSFEERVRAAEEANVGDDAIMARITELQRMKRAGRGCILRTRMDLVWQVLRLSWTRWTYHPRMSPLLRRRRR